MFQTWRLYTSGMVSMLEVVMFDRSTHQWHGTAAFRDITLAQAVRIKDALNGCAERVLIRPHPPDEMSWWMAWFVHP